MEKTQFSLEKRVILLLSGAVRSNGTGQIFQKFKIRPFRCSVHEEPR